MLKFSFIFRFNYEFNKRPTLRNISINNILKSLFNSFIFYVNYNNLYNNLKKNYIFNKRYNKHNTAFKKKLRNKIF